MTHEQEEYYADKKCDNCGGSGYILRSYSDESETCYCVGKALEEKEELRAEAQFEAERGN